eukprot:jgi/Mesvir1/14651/Mv05321-RA.1
MADREVPESVKQRLKARAERIRAEIKDRYAGEHHRAWCDGKNVSPPPFVTYDATVHIPYAVPDWGSGEGVDRMKSLVKPPGWVFDKHVAQILTHGNSLLAWQKRLPGFVPPDPDRVVDGAWLRRCYEYLSRLPVEDLYVLRSYTHQGDNFSNAVEDERGQSARKKIVSYNFKFRDLDDPLNHYHPLWVQFAREFRERGVPRNHVKMDKRSKRFASNADEYVRTKRPGLGLPPLPRDLDLGKCDEVGACVDVLEKHRGKLPADIEYALVNTIAGAMSGEYVADVIQPRYVKDLRNIILSSPATTRAMTVYRGSSSEYYLRNPHRQYYRSPTFVSTGIKPTTAYGFMNANSYGAGAKCCAMVLHVVPGSRCVPLFPGLSGSTTEFEILLPSGTVFYHESVQVKQYAVTSGPNPDHKYGRDDDCPPKGDAGKRYKVSVVYALTPPKRGVVNPHAHGGTKRKRDEPARVTA